MIINRKIILRLLDERSDMEEELERLHASWHKPYSVKVSQCCVRLLNKRSDTVSDILANIRPLDGNDVLETSTKEVCFFCSKTKGQLHTTATVE